MRSFIRFFFRNEALARKLQKWSAVAVTGVYLQCYFELLYIASTVTAARVPALNCEVELNDRPIKYMVAHYFTHLLIMNISYDSFILFNLYCRKIPT
jgi:hypothetical protein